MAASKAADEESAPSAAAGALLATLLMGVVFALLWSSAFSVAKIMVAYAPPFAVSSLRFAIAAALGAGIAAALGQRLPRGRAAWRAVLALGLFQNAFYLGFVFNAVGSVEASLVIVIVSALPLLVAALSPWALGERIGPLKALGLAVGFGGVLWATASRVAGGVDPAGFAFAHGALAALATATLLVRKADFGAGLLMVTACQMAVGAIGCLALALLFEDVTAFDWTPQLISALAYQILFPGLSATLLWFALLKRIPAADASAFHFLVPMAGVGFAALLLGERIGAADVVGVVAAGAGILIVNRAAIWERRRGAVAAAHSREP